MDTNGGYFDFDWLVTGANLTILVGDGVDSTGFVGNGLVGLTGLGRKQD